MVEGTILSRRDTGVSAAARRLRDEPRDRRQDDRREALVIVALLAAVHHDPSAVTSAVTPPPSPSVVVATGAAVTVLVSGLWALVGHVITIAHEGAHAATALVLGGRVRRVTLNANRDGSTLSQGALFRFPVTAAGYVGPSAFGLAGSALLAHGRAATVLWISLVLLGLLLLSSMNWFGRFLVVSIGGVLFLALRNGSDDVRTLVACALVWLLLIGGVAHVWKHRGGGADFADLRSMTFLVPAVVWAGLALLAACAALVTGGAWLIGALAPPF
jgi:Peptidase M50B-like